MLSSLITYIFIHKSGSKVIGNNNNIKIFEKIRKGWEYLSRIISVCYVHSFFKALKNKTKTCCESWCNSVAWVIFETAAKADSVLVTQNYGVIVLDTL